MVRIRENVSPVDMADNKHRVDPIELWTVVKEAVREYDT